MGPNGSYLFASIADLDVWTERYLYGPQHTYDPQCAALEVVGCWDCSFLCVNVGDHCF